MKYVLMNWDESRAGQDDQWAVHTASDGTEHTSWASDPREGNQTELYQAIAQADLPSDSNLLSAARQARAMAVLQAGDWAYRRESGSGAPW